MSGEQANLERIYGTLGGRLKQFIRAHVPDDVTAEDLLQEVFLRIHRGLPKLHDQSRLESWVFQIARHAIIDTYRSSRLTRPLTDRDDAVDETLREDPARRIEPSVREMIEQLPAPYRDALLLVEYEGVSQKELAARLGISASGAKSRVQRARSMLKEMLMHCCHFELDRHGRIIDYHEIGCCCCSLTVPHRPDSTIRIPALPPDEAR